MTALYVTAPTLAVARRALSHHAGPRRRRRRATGSAARRAWRSTSDGMLYVVDALAGAAGLYRVDVPCGGADRSCLSQAPTLIGVAFDPGGGLVVASNDRVWRFDVAAHAARVPSSTPA